jgi:hypothetical protein
MELTKEPPEVAAHVTFTNIQVSNYEFVSLGSFNEYVIEQNGTEKIVHRVQRGIK